MGIMRNIWGVIGNIRSIFWYCLFNRYLHILCVVAVVFLLSKYVHPWDSAGANTAWWSWVEPITGVATLAIAILVWFGEVAQDWEESLPKRLNISFLYEGKKVMFCKNAYLAGEGDIRAWGQQLGGQMAGNPRLKFKSFQQQPGKVQHRLETIKLYTLEINLEELPAESTEGAKIVNKEKVDKFKGGGCLIREYDPVAGDFNEDWVAASLCRNPTNT